MGTGSKTDHISYPVQPTSEVHDTGQTTDAQPPAPSEPAADSQSQAGDGDEATLEAAAEPTTTTEDAPSAEDETPADDDEPESGSHQEPDPGLEQQSNDDPPKGWAEALTPLPDVLPEGRPAGTPVLVGGEDLADATATLLSYSSAHGPREVLVTTVTEDAEAKLLEALALSEQKTVSVQVEEQVDGRLPLDEEKQLYEQVAKTAQSVNNKLKNATPVPPHSWQYHAEALAAVHAVLADPQAGDADKAMAAHYADALQTISEHANADPPLPYAEGGKIPMIDPYTVTGTVTVTKQVPAPLEAPEQGKLSAVLREAGRINATISPATGVIAWDGEARTPANGKEYLIDMGDGWSAVYRPYAANDPGEHEYSLRGQLEVHAPQGEGHGQQLVRRLGALHLVNRPMTAKEGEWTYLRNNITAQRLDKKPAISTALATAQHMEDLELQEIYHERQHEAAGLDEAGLKKLAKEFQLEAAARCLPKKVKLVRDAVAKATGFTDGTELATSPTYNPTPRTCGGWLTWDRFDVAGNTAAITKAWEGRSLVHNVGGGHSTLLGMFSTSVLASTERRALMGISPGLGMSETEDKNTGGANAVFTRVKPTQTVQKLHHQAALIWDDPSPLLRRSDYYAYNGDHFGAVNPQGDKSTKGQTSDPIKIAGFNATNNEVMFRNGIDLLGDEAPSRIICNKQTRAQLLKLFKKQGITHLAGKPVNDVVIAH